MRAPTTRLRLRVSPGAARPGIEPHGDAWKVRVAAAPEHGRANDAVLRLLADRLGVPSTSVRLVSGRTGRDKIVELVGLDADEADRRLSA